MRLRPIARAGAYVTAFLNRRRLSCAAAGALIALSPFLAVQACGPDFEPDVFVKVTAPDDRSAFAQGKLGIVQDGYDSDAYAVAYRYLNGGKLSAQEQAAAAPAAGPSTDGTKMSPEQAAAAYEAEQRARAEAQPAASWLAERAAHTTDPVPAKAQSFPVDYAGNIVFDPSYLNCPDGAFQNAALTLKKRSGAWGQQSRWLTDWIRGQDAVFANCAGKSATMPGPAPADGPALLREDRAYQLASAAFYAKQYDDAAQRFEEIAQDKDSPWKDWGGYLAARATVRKAFAMGKATDPWGGEIASFDMDTMRKAQAMLEGLLAERSPRPSREIVASELNFVRIRTEPEKRVEEICTGLAGPGTDANFGQDLKDLSYVLQKRIKIQNPHPLITWIAAWRGTGGGAEPGAAFALWQKNYELPWLVMAMVKAEPQDAHAARLLAAAEKIEAGSPAYDTVFYHRVRLLIGRNRTQEARALLDHALPAFGAAKPNSALNALLRERLAVARNFDEFLEFAPRTDFSQTSSGASAALEKCVQVSSEQDKYGKCAAKTPPLQLDEDSVYVLNRQTPLSLLVEAADSTKLPANLRQNVALAAWTRSVLLEDAASAGKLAPLLPKTLRQTANTGVGFQASLAILRNPGMRPFVEPGVSRLASFSYMDDFRDNWWCGSWEGKQAVDDLKKNRLPYPAFFTAEQRERAEAELQRLQKQPQAAALVGRRVVDYLKSHPGEADAAEALALAVRATHYACADWASDSPEGKENTAVSKAAFQLLHARYPKSPWAAKTKYYY